MGSGIWVIGEIEGHGLHPVTQELLSKSRSLREELGEELSCLLVGHDVARFKEEPFRYGADRVILVEDRSLEPFSETQLGKIIAELAREKGPSIILSGATERAKAFMPIAQTILETGLTANCMDLAIDPQTKVLLQTRPAYGGNLMATIVCRERRPQMATVRAGVFKAEQLSEWKVGPVEEVELKDELRQNPLTQVAFEPKSDDEAIPDYKGADVVVVAGRGVAEKGLIEKLKVIAQALGGVLGATRPVTDMGLLPRHAQIGQTGQVVSPTLYLGFGVSGAAPHTIGIQGSKVIVAVNKDPEAPIFKLANYGIVGDAKEIIDLLVDRLRDRTGRGEQNV